MFALRSPHDYFAKQPTHDSAPTRHKVASGKPHPLIKKANAATQQQTPAQPRYADPRSPQQPVPTETPPVIILENPAPPPAVVEAPYAITPGVVAVGGSWGWDRGIEKPHGQNFPRPEARAEQGWIGHAQRFVPPQQTPSFLPWGATRPNNIARATTSHPAPHIGSRGGR